MMPECCKCSYETEEKVVCLSCHEDIEVALAKTQKENERLKSEKKDLKNKIDLMKLKIEKLGRKLERKEQNDSRLYDGRMRPRKNRRRRGR